MFISDSSQPDQTREAGFDERHCLSAPSRRKPRSKEPLDQPTAILTTNSKISNKFLHALQAIDLLGERSPHGTHQLWKLGPIYAFVRVVLSRIDQENNSYMPSLLTGLFCKTTWCPTSQALLAYQRLDLATKEHVSIKTHLTSCDFCGAELQLLNRYCGDLGEYSFVEMPSQLRRLAEDLLKNSTATISGLAELGERPQVSH